MTHRLLTKTLALRAYPREAAADLPAHRAGREAGLANPLPAGQEQHLEDLRWGAEEADGSPGQVRTPAHPS